MDKVKAYASEPGVVIFSRSTCCLSYAVTFLSQELGVNPPLHEIDREPDYQEMERALIRMACSTAVPAVFIDGKLVDQ